jgi:hypothetical protein
MTTDKIKITMSERRPLSIDPKLWPVIAESSWYNGQYEFQANTIRRIKVRRHADGRTIVYGFQRAGDGGQHVGTRNPEAGFLLSAGSDPGETVRAIRRVAGVLDDDGLGEECIADLPAEDIDASETDAQTITMPLDGAKRLLALLDGSRVEDRLDCAAVAEELRAAIAIKTQSA